MRKYIFIFPLLLSLVIIEPLKCQSFARDGQIEGFLNEVAQVLATKSSEHLKRQLADPTFINSPEFSMFTGCSCDEIAFDNRVEIAKQYIKIKGQKRYVSFIRRIDTEEYTSRKWTFLDPDYQRHGIVVEALDVAYNFVGPLKELANIKRWNYQNLGIVDIEVMNIYCEKTTPLYIKARRNLEGDLRLVEFGQNALIQNNRLPFYSGASLPDQATGTSTEQPITSPNIPTDITVPQIPPTTHGVTKISTGKRDGDVYRIVYTFETEESAQNIYHNRQFKSYIVNNCIHIEHGDFQYFYDKLSSNEFDIVSGREILEFCPILPVKIESIKKVLLDDKIYLDVMIK